MSDKLIAVIVAVAFGIMLLTHGDGASITATEWSIDRGSSPDTVRLKLVRRSPGSRSESTFGTFPLKDLEGLTREQMKAVRSAVRFQIARDAGKLECEGTFVLGVGQGKYNFTPNPAFRAELEKLGYDSPGDEQLYSLVLHNVGLDLVREFGPAGPGRPSIHELIALRDRGVSLEMARQMRELGGDLSLRDLVRLRDHGVDEGYLRGLREAGYEMTAGDMVKLHDHGVGPEMVRGLKEFRFSAEDLVKLRDHGVSPEYVRELVEAGIEPSADHLVKLRQHGVPVELVYQARKSGYAEFGVGDLVKLSQHGVNGEYLRRIEAGGLKNLSADQIVKLRQHGVD